MSLADPENENRLISSSSSSRVHFPDSQLTPEHAGKIVMTFADDTKTAAEMHLGFLQEGKKYEVVLNIPALAGREVRIENSNTHVHVQGVHSSKDGHDVVVQIEALQDKLINDQLKIVNVSNDAESLLLTLVAKVLGVGQGTPLLKHGIKCIGLEDGDSDVDTAGGRRRKSSTRSINKHSLLHHRGSQKSPS